MTPFLVALLLVVAGAFCVIFMRGADEDDWRVLIAAGVLCAILVFIGGKALSHEAPPRPLYAFDVERVIDADTYEGTLHLPRGLVERGVRIRLACVQSPERRGPGRETGVMLAGLVRHWIEGRSVLIAPAGDGGFGRILADVFPPGWTESMSQRLYRLRWWTSPLYQGGQTTRAAVAACRRRMER